MKKHEIFGMLEPLTDTKEDRLATEEDLVGELDDRGYFEAATIVKEEAQKTYNHFSDLKDRLEEYTSQKDKNSMQFKQVMNLIKGFKNELQGYKDISQGLMGWRERLLNKSIDDDDLKLN